MRVFMPMNALFLNNVPRTPLEYQKSTPVRQSSSLTNGTSTKLPVLPLPCSTSSGLSLLVCADYMPLDPCRPIWRIDGTRATRLRHTASSASTGDVAAEGQWKFRAYCWLNRSVKSYLKKAACRTSARRSCAKSATSPQSVASNLAELSLQFGDFCQMQAVFLG